MTLPLSRSRPALRRCLLSLLAGLLYPLAFAPFDLWPLVLVSIALLWRLLPDQPRQAFLLGWLYGLGLFGFGVSWLHVSMHEHGGTPLWLALPMTGLFAAAMALFPALLAWATVRWGRGRPSPLLFAGLWLLLDVLRGSLLTGFPWLYAGYALVDTPLRQLAPVGGVWLVTLVTVLSAVALGSLGPGRRWRAPLVLALVGWLSAPLTPPARFVEPAADTPTPVALVQGNIPQDQRWLASMRDETRSIYRTLTERAAPGSLILWPEAALTEFYDSAYDFLMEQQQRLEARDSTLITGLPTRDLRDGRWQFFNSILVVAGGEGIYDKTRLVPFGEYVPLESALRGLIPFFDLPMSSFTRGPDQQDNLLAHFMVVSPSICYEVLYPEQVARQARNSNVLVTISNDAWFGTSAGPHQHFQMARMRALETGRWLLRATNTGITATIDPDGRVAARLPQFRRDLLQTEFMPMSGTTPFMHTGGWPTWLLAGLLVLSGLRAARTFRRDH